MNPVETSCRAKAQRVENFENKIASLPPYCAGDSSLLSRQVEQIESLVGQQEHAETKRRNALAASAAAHKEIDLLQDVLHTALRRMAELDDATDDARMTLIHKQEILKDAQILLEGDESNEINLKRQCDDLEKELFEQQTLLMDLQRRLLEAGVSPGSIAKIQSEAQNVENSPTKAAGTKAKTQQQPSPSKRRLLGIFSRRPSK